MTYNPDILRECTKKELMSHLKAEGITRVENKTLRKCTKPVLLAYMLKNLCVEAKEDNSTMEMIEEPVSEDQPEENKVYAIIDTVDKPSIANGNTWEESEVKEETSEEVKEESEEVNVDKLLENAKEHGETSKRRGSTTSKRGEWVNRIERLLASDKHKLEDGSYVFPREDAYTISGIEKTSTLLSYTGDWRPGYTGAGKNCVLLGFEANLSLIKDKEQLKLTPVSEERQLELMAKYGYKPLAKSE